MEIFYRLDKELQYYPTPEKLLEDVVYNVVIEKDNMLFLEPSAGDGAICRYIKDRFGHKNLDIHCIEKNIILANSLRGQEFKVIHDDFETFKENPIYDLIVMNPPFKKGVEHVLKAYNCLNGGGQIIAILNAESIKNDFSKDRKLLKNLIERVGQHQFMQGAFSKSERQTDVEIAVVYLAKPIYENEFDFFGNLKDEIKTNEELIADKFKNKVESSALMTFDSVNSAINMYRTIIEKLFKVVDVIKESFDVFEYLKKECDFFKIYPKEFLNYFVDNSSINSKEFVTRSIRQIIWSYVFNNTNCKQYIYSNDKANFYKQLNNGAINIPFTKDNILTFLEDIFLKREEFFKKGVENLFTEITSKHKNNSYHKEGWKTNKNWKINKKIIVDWGINFDYFISDRTGKVGHYQECLSDWVNDLDRLVRQIDKKLYNNYYEYRYIKEELKNKFNILGYIKPGDKYDNTCETHYFNLKFWKKGTLHIIFKNDKILEELNLIGANLRRDLGYEY